MPRLQPLLPLLRPVTAPRRAACACVCEQLFRFSTATALRRQQSPTTPRNARDAARAADLAAAEAAADADNPNAPAPKPALPSKRAIPSSPDEMLGAAVGLKPARPKGPSRATLSAAQKSTLELPPPRYHVARSSSRNLPIYTDYKRGGNLHLTTVRKITGDLSALRDELRVFLNKKNEDVKINSLTQHVIVKGHHVPQITEFLKARGM